MADQFLALDKSVFTETLGTQASGSIIVIGPRKTFTISVDGKCYINWSSTGATTALPELVAADYTTVVFTAPDQITRAAGSWADDGYNVAGRSITVAGAADPANNGTFEIESATATDLTTVETTLANEVASATERINGTAPLEVADTDTLLPAAGTYTFQSHKGFEQIRLYNPDAVASVLATVYIAAT